MMTEIKMKKEETRQLVNLFRLTFENHCHLVQKN